MIWLKNFIEIMFSFSLFINALLFVPQIIKLIRVKDSRELSLLTFVGFSFIQILMILHGLINHDYLLAFGFLASLLACCTMSVLIIHFRKEKKS
jgi:uncharacterized protein with PQ loop repeat